MRYSAKVLEQLLLKLQSLYYDGYKNCTIKDALTLLLNQETIADYNNIEWTKFKDDLIGFYPLPTARELRQDPFCEFNPQSKIEEFIKNIIPLEERVRVLTFFRDNADEVLFNNNDCTECYDFRKECARLICKCIEEGKRTEYHGKYLLMAHPSLEAIANAKPLPSLSKEEQIIAENIPHYPHEEEGLFSYEVIFWVAKYFIEDFLKQSDTFNRTHEETNKPCMSLQKYKDPIRDWLIRIANRYLYFDENPIYQVIWVMGVLIRLKPKQDWWTKKLADNIVNYLDCTKFLCDTKINMDKAIADVRRLTEQTLFDEPAIQQPSKSKECSKHRDINVKQIVDDLVAQIQQHQDPHNVQVNMHIGHVDQVYADAENMNMHAERVEHVHNTQTEQPATPPKYTSYCTYIVPNAGKTRDEIETDIIRASKQSGNVFAMFLNNYEEKGYLDFRGEPKSDIFSYLKERYQLPYDIENFRKFFKPKIK